MFRATLITLSLCAIATSLSSQEVLIVPYWKGAMHEGIYAGKKKTPIDQLSHYQKLNLLFKANGDVLRPTDLTSTSRLQNARAIIFETLPTGLGKSG